MRVVYVCTDEGIPTFGRKGSSVHVQAILTQLVDRGDEVHLVTPRPGTVAPPHLTGVTVHQLVRTPAADAAAREAGAQSMDLQVATVLDELHAQAPVDLVYERYALWGRSGTAWARSRGVTSILEVNSPLPVEQAAHRVLVDRRAADLVAAGACGDADLVVCVSEAVAAWVRSLGTARPDSVHVVPNGVDTRRFAPEPVRWEPRTFTLGFVGTLKPWHGVHDLVRALAVLRRTDPTYRLLLVGDGPERPALEQLVADLGLARSVEITGAVDPDDIPAQLARMDLAVAPYPPLENFYFSPLKVYEYLAAGLPVVASDVGPLPGLLVPACADQIGAVYPAGSILHLADAVSRLRHAPAARADLARHARQAMVDRHDWRRVLEQVLELTEVGRVPTQAT
jgi:glycosyltransferase involved in cell wall biosynthesis